MKKIFLFLLILASCSLFLGCEENNSVRCVTDYTNALLNNDLKKADAYVVSTAETTVWPQDILRDMVAKNILKKTDIEEITEIKEGKNKASVSLTINTPNPTKLMNRAVECAVEKYFLSEITTKEGLNEYIADEIKADLKMSGLTIEPKTLKVILEKEKGEWKITETSQVAIGKIIMGNIEEVSLSRIK